MGPLPLISSDGASGEHAKPMRESVNNCEEDGRSRKKLQFQRKLEVEGAIQLLPGEDETLEGNLKDVGGGAHRWQTEAQGHTPSHHLVRLFRDVSAHSPSPS
jgi:hypothetical protein